MSKLLAALIAGLFAAGVYAQTTPAEIKIPTDTKPQVAGEKRIEKRDERKPGRSPAGIPGDLAKSPEATPPQSAPTRPAWPAKSGPKRATRDAPPRLAARSRARRKARPPGGTRSQQVTTKRPPGRFFILCVDRPRPHLHASFYSGRARCKPARRPFCNGAGARRRATATRSAARPALGRHVPDRRPGGQHARPSTRRG